MPLNTIVVIVFAVIVLACMIAVLVIVKKALSSLSPQRNEGGSPREGEFRREIEHLRSEVELSKRQAAVEVEAAKNKAAAEKSDLERAKNFEIEDLKVRLDNAQNMKSKLSVKLLGESLEQHCEIAFEEIRGIAVRNVEFTKDNEAIEGTKGDYIYREFDDDGIEVVSIMFEMKNEAEGSINTKTNESHLKKLDKDRTKKNCEYAVLVSMLEPESDLYNTGIVDKSHLYPKMYVVRPQFFVAIIGIIRNAALSSLESKRQLARMLKSQPDVTSFEDKLTRMKDGVLKSNGDTQNKCESALRDIDQTIKKLEAIRGEIEAISTYSKRTSDRMDDITIRRLTHGNPAMKAEFDKVREAVQE